VAEVSTLPRRFAAHLTGLGLEPGPVVIAVSGGPDSLALLYLMRDAASSWELIIAHVDHGIHPDSAAVAADVRRVASELGAPFEMVTLALGPGTSETRARDARYRWLRDLARERKAWLFTAHHRDDQVETVLMRVLKGSGPAGLAGIAPVSGRLVRPLLPFGREEIRGWLASRGVQGWEDPANHDPKHLRSWLRTELIPSARLHVPAIDQRLVGLAEQAATDRAAWDAVVDLLALDVEREGEGFHFNALPLHGKPASLVESLFQAIARRHGLVLGTQGAGRVARLIGSSQSGRRVDLTGGWEARLEFGRVSVRIAPLAAGAAPPGLTIDGASGETTWDGWRISWKPDSSPSRQDRISHTAWLEPANYTVRAWRPGDRIAPLGGTGSRLVVRCMQDVKLPAARRLQWPVVNLDAEVVWVPGVCLGRAASSSEPAIRIAFEPVLGRDAPAQPA
jgi:tRNA(Ile)-lysidine synthase